MESFDATSPTVQQPGEKADIKPDQGKKYNVGRWTDREHELFLEALLIYGKDWDLIESHIQTRDAAHARSHAQKFFMKLAKYLDGDTEIGEI